MADKDWILRYGALWPPDHHPFLVERDCVRAGGKWKMPSGAVAGAGLFHHYKRGAQILWPHLLWHRWADLQLKEWLTHRTIVCLGPASSGKTTISGAVCHLLDYYFWTEKTTIMCCSTTKERLEDRVWGEFKNLHRMARARFDFIPGHLIEGRLRIVTDDRDDDEEGRNFKNGLLGVALQNKAGHGGLSTLIGIKNERLRLIIDEAHLCARVVVDALSNLDKNPDFKVTALGNPKDTTDALGILAEPAIELGGWDGGVDQAPGTKTWPTRRPEGICIQLWGPDSPNLDGKLGIPLITQEAIDRDIAFYGRDSLQFTMMNEGRMPRGQGSRRVLTRDMCQKFGALNKPLWKGTKITKIAFLDAAYRGVGGDRCVFGELQFGEEATVMTDAALDALVRQQSDAPRSRQILALIETMIVPIKYGINPNSADAGAPLPEEQIVEFVREQCATRGIPAENFFFDAGMRTSLVSAFGRMWSTSVESIDCGGRPTEEMVSAQIRVPWSKYGSKYITQIWFNVRHVVEAGQFRGMTEDVMSEFCSREWGMVGGNKVELEPKSKMKEKCFVAGTMVSTPHGEVPIESLKSGDLVETPFGPSEIYSVNESATDAIFEVKLHGGRSISGTGDHKVFTWDSGWVTLCDLSLRSRLESINDLSLWKILNFCFTKGKNTGFTNLVDILGTERIEPKITRSGLCTGLSGRSVTGEFLKECASIIRMAIGEIIRCPIWGFGILESIPHFIFENAGRIQNSERGRWQGCQRRSKIFSGGEEHQRGENGKASKQRSIGLSANPGSAIARFVKSGLKLYGQPNSALVSAPTIILIRGIMTRLQSAWCVVKSLWRSVTATDFIAVKSVQQLPCGKSEKVYDLTLCEHNAYYANGILVSNCGRSPDLADAVSIGVLGATRRGFLISNQKPPIDLRAGPDWRTELKRQAREQWKSGNLNYAA